MGSHWSPEQVTLLKSLWGQGQPASAISVKLGGTLTRNAVLGKLHRMNIDASHKPAPRPPRMNGHAAPPKPRRPVQQSPSMPRLPTLHVAAEPHRPAPPPRIILPEPVPSGKTTIIDLSDRVCRWPIGEPGEAAFHFCGTSKASDADTSYCPYHAQRAVSAVQPKSINIFPFRINSGRSSYVR